MQQGAGNGVSEAEGLSTTDTWYTTTSKKGFQKRYSSFQTIRPIQPPYKTHTYTHTHIHIHTQVTARPCTSTVFSSDGSITLPDVTHGCLTKKLRRLHIVSVPGKTDAQESAVVNAAECRSFSRMLQVYSGEEQSF